MPRLRATAPSVDVPLSKLTNSKVVDSLCVFPSDSGSRDFPLLDSRLLQRLGIGYLRRDLGEAVFGTIACGPRSLIRLALAVGQIVSRG